ALPDLPGTLLLVGSCHSEVGSDHDGCDRIPAPPTRLRRRPPTAVREVAGAVHGARRRAPDARDVPDQGRGRPGAGPRGVADGAGGVAGPAAGRAAARGVVPWVDRDARGSRAEYAGAVLAVAGAVDRRRGAR